MKEYTGKHPRGTTDDALVPPDPHVTATLRSVVGEPPYHLVDWDALRASIVGDAAALLTRRVRRSWTVYVTRWARTTVPVGLAACLAAGVFVVYTGRAMSSLSDEVALTPAGVLSTVTGVSSRTALAASVMQPLRSTAVSEKFLGDFPQ